MKTRPRIIEGDIVKLSRKRKLNPGDIPKNTTLRVVKVIGDGIDWSSEIHANFGRHVIIFARDDVWKTGFNINDENLELSIDAPINNNDRVKCYVCEHPTKTIKLLISEQQICTNSNCKWFEN